MRAAGLAALAGLLLLDGAGSPAPAGEDLGWTRYRNARFAVSVEYPSRLFADTVEALNGDGIRSEPERGLSLRIWGRYDVLDERPHQALCLKSCAGETYRVDRPTTGISSGLRDGAVVYYKKCVLRDGEFHCFALEYPETKRRLFDPVAARMSRSLR
jgi:hypothetical protein